MGDIWLRLDKKSDRTRRQMAEHLSLSPEQVEDLARANYRHYLTGIQESAQLPGLAPDQILSQVADNGFTPAAREALSLGKGLVIASAHLGNWIWFSTYLHLAGIIDGHVINPFSDPDVDAAVTRLRTCHGLPLWNRKGVMHKAARVLKKGGSFSIMMDLDLGSSGWMLPFLGKAASTNPVPVELAVRAHTPILLAALVRAPSTSDKPFLMLHEPVIVPQEDSEEEARRILALINNVISDWIRAWPDQWWWQNKRWRTQRVSPRKRKRPHRSPLTAGDKTP